MSQNRSRSWLQVVQSLAFPMLIGLSVYVCLILMIQSRTIGSDLVYRYIMGHPVSQLTTAMFCVGMAALAIATRNIVIQFLHERKIHLDLAIGSKEKRSLDSQGTSESDKDDSEPVNIEQERAVELLDHLNQMPYRKGGHYLWNRLNKGLRFIQHHHGSDGLDDHLRTLADEDEIERGERYSLVKILIWATPMLGFLGTVIGISEALGGIGGGEFQAMMDRLKGSLYVAFDTTALALTFSILMMFAQFVVDRFETQLLNDVDAKSRDELAKHYESFGASVDASLLPVHRLGRMIMTANHELVQRQVEMWQKSIELAQSAWIDAAQQSQTAIRDQLNSSLNKTTEQLSQHVTTVVSSADQAMEKRWEQWQTQFSENARLLREHQEQLVEQTNTVHKVMNATGEVIRLQDALEKNLASLSGATNFEDAVTSLSAAIHLLHQRLGQSEREPNQHQLRIAPESGKQNSSKEDAA